MGPLCVSSEEEDMDDEDVYSEISDLSQIADDDLYTVDQINSFLDVTKAKPIPVEQYFSGFKYVRDVSDKSVLDCWL